MTRIGWVALAAVSMMTVAVAGCSTDSGSSTDSASAAGAALAAGIEEDQLVGHLERLQEIAVDHDGNRASGTSGYDASVDYVVQTLTDAGFDVETPEFEFDQFVVGDEILSADDRDIPVEALQFSPTTPDGGLVARFVASAPDALGCTAEEWGDADLTGAVALTNRGTCEFGQKARVAAERGAVALLIANNEDGIVAGTLGGTDNPIPVGGISRESGADLRAQPPGHISLTLETETTTSTSRNVIAQTSTGSTDNVVVVGAHLDGVPEGPGINDNGSGVAAVLETARRLGGDPEVTNAVRFAFWGAEELGLFGSEKYVEGLSDEELLQIALYLNYDMVGSPNAGYLTYDGDDSDREGAPAGPEGSAAIERVSEIGLLEAGVSPNGTDFDGRSDYAPFVMAGIPAGGVFSGADDEKTELQAELWGGEANEPFDPNYHSAEDTLDNVDREAFLRNSRAAAFTVGSYAYTVEGPNGVPVGDARVEARATE